MRKSLIFFLLLCIAVSCNKNNDAPEISYLTGDGVFIVNEGNFLGGNGSLSFYSGDSAKIYNHLFADVNSRPLGDVPNAMEIYGDLAYIVVNNSGKIEVLNKSTLESVKTITGLISPRNIGFVNADKAYVTSIYSDSLVILNLNDNTISGYIDIRRSSESIIVAGEKAYVANWVGGNEVMVINGSDDKLVDSVQVGIEPESMALDRNNILWVLCNGGWTRENYAELDGIDLATNTIEKQFIFPSKEASPVCLKADGGGDALFYLENGVHKMSIDSQELPSDPLIPQTDHYFYKLGISPGSGEIFVTDAVDYQQRGYLLRYSSEGVLISSVLADIIPGSLCFKSAGK